MKVSKLYSSTLPKEFTDTLELHCTSCGSENEITNTLSTLFCPNLSCPDKVVMRMVGMLKDLDIKNLGESKCMKFLEHFETTNPYALFAYEPDENGPLYEGCSDKFSNEIYEQVNQKRNMMLWEYVKYANLPGIRETARYLFFDYASLEDFYEDMETADDSIAFIEGVLKGSEKADIAMESGDYSITALKIYDTLTYFKDELFEFIEYVDLKEIETETLNVAISRSVGKPYVSKKDFVNRINAEFADKVHINFLEAVTHDCDYLIWSGDDEVTSKVKAARKRNFKNFVSHVTSLLEDDIDASELLAYGLDVESYNDAVSVLEDMTEEDMANITLEELQSFIDDGVKMIKIVNGATFKEILENM